MLLHAFGGRAGAGEILAAAAGGDGRPGDVALLSAVSICFALGAATVEQFKHLTAAAAGPLAGLAALPDLRTLQPKLAAIADRTDPVALQRLFASAMLAADRVVSGVYYVDDHFVPYAGAKPVRKGWNNKRGRAEKGRAGTHVTAHHGRAVCFVTGEPSGLTATLPKALAELKKAAGPGAKIMLGFDRDGAYAQVFRHCRDQDVHWVTYRRAPLAVPAALPVITTITAGDRIREVTWAGEKVQLKDCPVAVPGRSRCALMRYVVMSPRFVRMYPMLRMPAAHAARIAAPVAIVSRPCCGKLRSASPASDAVQRPTEELAANSEASSTCWTASTRTMPSTWLRNAAPTAMPKTAYSTADATPPPSVSHSTD